MKKRIKETERLYEPPKIKGLEINQSGIMCQSGVEVTNAWDGQEEEW